MSRIAYVNGRYVGLSAAAVSVEDRGYQFADGVYEVIAFKNRTLLDEVGHLDRLARSLHELHIVFPIPVRALRLIMRETIRRNHLKSGILYIQVTRGVAPRDHSFPSGVRPSLIMTVRRARPPSQNAVAEGIAVLTMPDSRWSRCDIKSVGLLPNVLCKQAAKAAGAYEAWLVDRDGLVTEGSSTNAWIVVDGTIVTRESDAAILNGVTRLAVLDAVREAGLTVKQRAFTVAEAQSASEAFLTSTTSTVLPVVAIDNRPVGTGEPGPVSLLLRRALEAAIDRQVAELAPPLLVSRGRVARERAS